MRRGNPGSLIADTCPYHASDKSVYPKHRVWTRADTPWTRQRCRCSIRSIKAISLLPASAGIAVPMSPLSVVLDLGMMVASA
jgi:hypothetical protein